MPVPIVEVHFHAARVIIGQPELAADEERPNITHPLTRCRVITTNGQIWDRPFYTFGLTVEGVIADWNLRLLSNWTRIDPSA